VDQQVRDVRVPPRAFFVAAEPVEEEGYAPACREMILRTLDFCEKRTRLQGHAAVSEALRQGNYSVHDYFLYGLAREIGHFLGKVEAAVKAVYLFEPESMPGEVNGRQPDVPRGLDLIVWVDIAREELAMLVEALDGELLQQYKALVGPSVATMRYFLSVEVACDRDVQTRRGAGGLITSLHTRPLEVWSRFVLRLNADHCGGCRICTTICPYEAITISPGATTAKIDLEKCQACGLCYSACPAGAIESAYYDFASLARNVQSSVRADGYRAVALTCRGSTPTREEIEEILGAPGFVPICLPCVGRTPPEFFLKALTMGIERIAVIPCQEDHCRFQDGSRISRNRFLLMQALLQEMNYDPSVLIFREGEGPIVTVDEDLCTGCGTCVAVCPYYAIRADSKNDNTLFVARVDPELCQGCGLCAASCPSRAIEMSRFADLQMISQIEAALATGAQDGGPRVLGFRCNWCSYDDNDLPFDPVHYTSQNIEVIGVPCVGRVDALHVLWAFLNGADGVFLGGCPPGDCRYVSGSDQAERRFTKLQELLDAAGFDSRRLRTEWFKRGSQRGYGDVIRSFASDIGKLGTTPIH
jgi:coenzyme F420-reducing hydrogenase delta subunit/Pyruvate/2-oxoacid:ferredoxin oxidoreductase delta subunit